MMAGSHKDETVQQYRVMKIEAAEKMNINPEYWPCVYSIDNDDRGGPARSIKHPREPDCAITPYDTAIRMLLCTMLLSLPPTTCYETQLTAVC